jgi:hypothetical protein
VLAAGGDPGGSAEVYDPLSDTWKPAGGAGAARFGATATLLWDGRVLLAGGRSAEGAALSSVETYRPFDNSIVPLDAKLTVPRADFASVRQTDHRVLFVGGANESAPAMDTTDLFDPAGDIITAGPGLFSPRANHSATLLADGRILVAGGSNGHDDLDTAEIYDPARIAFFPVESHLQRARRNHAAILVPGNGGVLLAGGLAGDQPLKATEMFQPVEDQFVALGDLTLARSAMAVAAIAEGSILAAGGLNADGPQSACGILLTPHIEFAKSVYRPLDGILLSGGNFRGGTKITFTLELISGTTVTLANNRLATPSVTTPLGTITQLFTGFSTVPILSTTGSDAGRTVLLIAQFSGSTLQVTAPIRIQTFMQLSLPTGIYEGLDTSFSAQLTRSFSSPPLTGTLVLSATQPPPASAPGSLTDGSSNTVVFTESSSPNSTSIALNSAGNSAGITRPMPAIARANYLVVASYSGDDANDPVSATASFAPVSRAPSMALGLPASAQAGLPVTISASVAASQGNPQFNLTGDVDFQIGGFALGPAQITARQSNPPRLTASRQFTPLSLGPVSFTALYHNDPFFKVASTFAATMNVVKATPLVTVTTAPATFSCDEPVTFSAQLAYPSNLGHSSNLTLSGAPVMADGSVPLLGTESSAPLLSTGPGTASATLTVPRLPISATGLLAKFPGDVLIDAASSKVFRPVLQRSAATLTVAASSSTVASPAQIQLTLATPRCSESFTGSVELLDGNNPIAVIPIPLTFRIATPGAGTTLNLVQQVLLPAGTHSISARYSGDSTYISAISPALSLLFQ